MRMEHNEAPMMNIAAVLKFDTSRLVRKQSRADVDPLKKLVSSQHSEMALLIKRQQELEKTLKSLEKLQSAGAVKPSKTTSQADDTQSNLRFRAKGLASNRKRLGLSAAEFALMVGTAQQSIFSWSTPCQISAGHCIAAGGVYARSQSALLSFKLKADGFYFAARAESATM